MYELEPSNRLVGTLGPALRTTALILAACSACGENPQNEGLAPLGDDTALNGPASGHAAPSTAEPASAAETTEVAPSDEAIPDVAEQEGDRVGVTQLALLTTGTDSWYNEGTWKLHTEGASLSCQISSKSTCGNGCTHNNTVKLDCKISDTLVDDDGVYAKYRLDGYPEKRTNWYGHDGERGTFLRTIGGDDPVRNLSLKVCRDKGSLVRDNCAETLVPIYPD